MPNEKPDEDMAGQNGDVCCASNVIFDATSIVLRGTLTCPSIFVGSAPPDHSSGYCFKRNLQCDYANSAGPESTSKPTSYDEHVAHPSSMLVAREVPDDWSKRDEMTMYETVRFVETLTRNDAHLWSFGTSAYPL